MDNSKSLEQLARDAYSDGEEAVVELVVSPALKLKEEKHRRSQNSTNSSFPSSGDLASKKKNNSRKKQTENREVSQVIRVALSSKFRIRILLSSVLQKVVDVGIHLMVLRSSLTQYEDRYLTFPNQL